MAHDDKHRDSKCNSTASTGDVLVVEGITFRDVATMPLARDLDIAKRLGFTKLYDIRKLIKRHENSLGIIVATVANNAGGRGRRGSEYWLTEEQVLFVVTKSETLKAVEITKEMIRIFLLFKNGHAPSPPPGISEARVIELIAMFAQATLLRNSANAPFIGKAVADAQILLPLRQYARMKVRSLGLAMSKETLSSERHRAEKRVRGMIGFEKDARAAFQRMPESKLGAAIQAVQFLLYEIRHDLQRQGKSECTDDELPLWDHVRRSKKRAPTPDPASQPNLAAHPTGVVASGPHPLPALGPAGVLVLS